MESKYVASRPTTPIHEKLRRYLIPSSAVFWLAPLALFLWQCYGLAITSDPSGLGQPFQRGLHSPLKSWLMLFMTMFYVYIALKKANVLTLLIAGGLLAISMDTPQLGGRFTYAAQLSVFAYLLVAGWFYRRGSSVSMPHLCVAGFISIALFAGWSYMNGRSGMWSIAESRIAVSVWAAALLIPTVVLMIFHRSSTRAKKFAGQVLMPNSAQTRATDDTPAAPSVTKQISTASDRSVANASIVAPNEAPNYLYPAKKTGVSFSDIQGMDDTKKALITAAERMIERGSRENGILLHGDPGNGKTFFAQCLAGELGVSMVSFSFGGSASMWLNESTTNAMTAFNGAIEQAPCVLFIDEIDSLVGKRGNLNNAGEADKMTTAILEKMVELRGRGVVLIAATNNIAAIDSAAVREGRFDVKLAIPNPDKASRRQLIESALSEKGLLKNANKKVINWVVEHFSGFAVSRILTVSRACARIASETGCVLSADLFLRQLRESQGGVKHSEQVPELSSLSLPKRAQETLSNVVGMMRSPFEFSEAGGEIPKGMLFHGAPGTGKTLVANALAKSGGWNLVVGSGTELAQNASLIDKLIDEAISLKPSVLFIDEAEPLLQSRSSNWNAGAAAKFLQRTGSDTSDLKDVILIAATNFPENIDAAMLRGGRFELHIEFLLPDAEAIAKHVDKELLSFTGHSLIDAQALSETLVGKSLADVNFSLRQAKNRAAARALREKREPELRMNDFEDDERNLVSN